MNRNDKQAVALLAEKGFAYNRTNSKGARIYVNGASGKEWALWLGVKDFQNFRKQLLREIGEATSDNKRNPMQIKERQRQEREWRAAVDRRNEAIRLELLAAKSGNVREAQRQHQLWVAADHEVRELERLMRTPPGF